MFLFNPKYEILTKIFTGRAIENGADVEYW